MNSNDTEKSILKDFIEEILSEDSYILSNYHLFDKRNHLLIYQPKRMEQLCPDKNKTGAYYLTPFSKVEKNEYIYTTVTKEFEPIETCGILLFPNENEQILKL